eukprot:c22523_g1_i2 orf=4-387(-)
MSSAKKNHFNFQHKCTNHTLTKHKNYPPRRRDHRMDQQQKENHTVNPAVIPTRSKHKNDIKLHHSENITKSTTQAQTIQWIDRSQIGITVKSLLFLKSIVPLFTQYFLEVSRPHRVKPFEIIRTSSR